MREKLLPESGSVSQIAMSAMADFGGEIAERDVPALIIIEGLTMYLSEADVRRIFAVIDKRFETATVLAEIMNPTVVKHFKEKSIEGSRAKFTWGIRDGKALASLLPDFRFAEEHALTEGMAEFVPVYKLLDKLPAVFRHIYVLFFVVISFVIFNANDMSGAWVNLRGMFGFNDVPLVSSDALYYLRSYAVVLLIAVVGATPLFKRLAERLSASEKSRRILNIAEPVFLVALLCCVTAFLIDGSFNPFLYFRF